MADSSTVDATSTSTFLVAASTKVVMEDTSAAPTTLVRLLILAAVLPRLLPATAAIRRMAGEVNMVDKKGTILCVSLFFDRF